MLATTIVALERRGFGIDVVDDFEAARSAVLARIPRGASVLTHRSVLRIPQQRTQTTGPADFALGSVDAITRDGVLVIASASGSELASYASDSANVIFVVGAQKLMTPRDFEHSSRVGKILQIHRADPGRIHVVLVREIGGG
jgi:hypothetical protein